MKMKMKIAETFYVDNTQAGRYRLSVYLNGEEECSMIYPLITKKEQKICIERYYKGLDLRSTAISIDNKLIIHLDNRESLWRRIIKTFKCQK